jgi:hypothetical protein
MRFADFPPPPRIPRALMLIDPDAGDCTCVNPVQMQVPPTQLVRQMKAALLKREPSAAAADTLAVLEA